MRSSDLLISAGVSEPAPGVLVVDDDATTRLLARESLSRAGFAVHEAGDGSEALELFGRERPEIVLLDVKMPRKDGFTTCAELRRDPAGRHVPVLMMTGLEDLASIKRAYEVGATDFTTKPLNWVIVRHRIEYMLRASRSAAKLRVSRSRLANAQRIAKLGSWEWRACTDEIALSSELYRILGVEDWEGIISTLADFLQRVHEDERPLLERAFAQLATGAKPPDLEFRVVRPDGAERFVQQQAVPVRDEEGRPVGADGTVQDVTEHKNAERQIRYLAYYDGLTALPNRRAFVERLGLALADSSRLGRHGALLFLDLDRFQRINHTFGHSLGDDLLRRVARRLTRSVRSLESSTRSGPGDLVARFGGDEFVVLLNEVSELEDGALVARRINDVLAEPFQLDDRDIVVTSSIGIAVFPDDGESAEVLLANAETAMHHAKEQGGKSCQYYSEAMNASALERLALESRLGSALEGDELELHYQPQFDLATGRIVGAEALIRWRHPEMGLLLPKSFIPLAEEIGLIGDIGRWVLETACRQAQAWQRPDEPPVRVAVNLSGRQFGRWNLPQVVTRALKEAGLDPTLLELELTESTLMRDSDAVDRALGELKELGVRIAVDDFGTGYSSLSYLRRFQVDALKIDRSFLHGVPTGTDNTAITAAILAMARSLNLEVVAEGVEEEEQLAFLVEQGCTLAQGYLLGRPAPERYFARLLAAPPYLRPQARIA